MALLTPVPDDNARAVDYLAGVAFTVEDAETGPLAQQLAVGDLDEGDFVLRAQGNNKFLVGFFFARLVENTHVCLATVERLGCLAQTSGEAVVDEGEFEDTCEVVIVRINSSLALFWTSMLVRELKRTFQGIEDRH